MEKRYKSSKRPPKITSCGHCNNKFLMNNVQKWKEANGKASIFFCGRVCAAKWRTKQPGAKVFERTGPIVPRPRKARSSAAAPLIPEFPHVLDLRKKRSNMDAFMETLGSGWMADFALPTMMREGSGYAASYMIDIANPAMRMAIDFIEPRQPRNFRKEDFLRSRGWTLLRFPRREIEGNLNFCVKMVWTAISRLAAA